MNQNFDKFKDKLLSFIDSKEKKISNVPEPEKVIKVFLNMQRKIYVNYILPKNKII